MSSDTNSPQTLKEVNVSGYVYDKQTFTEFESLHTLQQRTIETLYKSCYQNSLNQVVELYKIITLLSLYKVNINYEFR